MLERRARALIFLNLFLQDLTCLILVNFFHKVVVSRKCSQIVTDPRMDDITEARSCSLSTTHIPFPTRPLPMW